MERVQKIQQAFEDAEAVFRRDFTVGERRGVLLFCPDVTDEKILRGALFAFSGTRQSPNTLDELLSRLLPVSEASIEDDDKAVQKLLEGDGVLLLDGMAGFIDVAAKKFPLRAVTEPPTETVVHGPREGFVEDLITNAALLQKRLKNPRLAIKKRSIGRQGSTLVAVAYLGGIAPASLVKHVEAQLEKLQIDAVIDSNYLVSLLEQNPRSIFPQVGIAEKPDVVAAKLLEGRVAILVDGSPIVLTVPFFLIEDFQASGDYYTRSGFATFLRLLRLSALLLAVFLPGVYVAAVTFHYDVMPLKLLITVLNATKGIPLPPLWEMLLILFLFEIIRETSVRMPKSLSTAIGLVGAIVLGDTAVKAGIISSPGVLIVALSSLALYAVPSLVCATGLLRILFTILGGIGGLYGLSLGAVALTLYVCGLSTGGKPYLSPLAPFVRGDQKDALMRAPLYKMQRRPRSIGSPNKTRIKI